jgi:hypothetical protein
MLKSNASWQFHHRVDELGEHVSFCMECFLTVARSKVEGELAAGEQRHMCQGPPLGVDVGHERSPDGLESRATSTLRR